MIEALRRLPPGVGRLGLGLAALGRPGYINLGHAGDLSAGTDPQIMQANAFGVLDAAYAAGVRYFDAARSYGKAEEFLGAWLTARGLSPDQVSVGSKWGYTYTANWRVNAEVHEVKDLTVDTLRRQYAESRHNLGDNLQLYQIHSATLDSGVLDDPAVRDELARLRSGGLGIGLSTSGPRQRDTIERALEVGGFDAVQATYNLLETSAGPALAAAHEAGLSVIIKEAVANGRLTGRGDVAVLKQLAAEAELGPDQLALAAVLAQPWVDVVLSGAATPEVLASNLKAATVTPSPEQLDHLGALREDPESYWETRSALPWN